MMYEEFYRLAERPFELTPNPRYLFLSSSHTEALAMLQYGAGRRHGLMLLVGEAGMGKTTLVYAALETQTPEKAFSVFLTNPALTRDEFFEFLAWGFGLSCEAGSSKSRLLNELSQSLAEREKNGCTSTLIVDEAQCLSDTLLDEIRLLGNIETATTKLLSIILIGQPEFAERLNVPSMRQLKQRVALRCILSPLTADETAAYITTRIRVAGADARGIFGDAAIAAIHRASSGIPRVISVLCENALISGFVLKRRPIGVDVVNEVCRDLGIDVVEAVQARPDPIVETSAPQRFSFF